MCFTRMCFRVLYDAKERKSDETAVVGKPNTGSHLVVRRADIFVLRFKYQRQSKTCGKEAERGGRKKLAQPEAQSTPN